MRTARKVSTPTVAKFLVATVKWAIGGGGRGGRGRSGRPPTLVCDWAVGASCILPPPTPTDIGHVNLLGPSASQVEYFCSLLGGVCPSSSSGRPGIQGPSIGGVGTKSCKLVPEAKSCVDG